MTPESNDPALRRRTRIGNADRDRAADRLAGAVASGHLPMEAYSARLALVHAAQDQGDLENVMHDLPKEPEIVSMRARLHLPKWARYVASGAISAFLLVCAIVFSPHAHGLSAVFLIAMGVAGIVGALVSVGLLIHEAE